MSEHSPQPQPQPTTTPEQAARGQEAARQWEAERRERMHEVLAGIDPETIHGEGNSPETSMSMREYLAHKDALEHLESTNGHLPEEMALKRDWSDTLAQHKEKETGHKEAAKVYLAERIATQEEAIERHAQQKVHRQKIAKVRKTDAKRFKDHNAMLEERGEREAVKNEYIAREKLKRGERMSELFMDEIKAGADAHVNEKLGPAKHKDSVVDTAALKAERLAKQQAAEPNATSEALKNFQRGFAGIDPQQAKAENQSTGERLFADAEVFVCEPDSKGRTQVGFAYEGDGNIMDWKRLEETADRENREILVYLEDGNRLYVDGDTIFDMNASKRTGRPEGFRLDENEDLPTAVIGEGWKLDDNNTTAKVVAVEIMGPLQDYGPWATEEGVKKAEADGVEFWVDPFKDAWDELQELKKADKANTAAKTDVADGEAVEPATGMELVLYEGEAKTTRGRIRNLMGQAWDTLKGTAVRRHAAAITAMSSRSKGSFKEYFTNGEKGGRRRAVGFVLGAVTVGAAVGVHAYLNSKGHGLNVDGIDLKSAPKHDSIKQLHDATGTVYDPKTHVASSIHSVAYHPQHVELQEHAQSLSLRNGDSIEGRVSDYLQQHNMSTSGTSVRNVTQHILDEKHLSWPDARSLPVDYSFNMPPHHILKELLEAKS